MTKPKAPFKEIVMIFWKDAYVTTDDDPKLAHTNDLTISIGVIIKEDDKEVTISTFWDGIAQEFSSPYQCIPKGVIRHIKKIKT
jgi:hypothetical protein